MRPPRRPRGRIDIPTRGQQRANRRSGSPLAMIFIGMFLCGLLSAVVALSQIFSFAPDGSLVIRLPNIGIVQAQGVPLTPEAYPQPMITPLMLEPEIVVRGVEAPAETASALVVARRRDIQRHVVQPGDTIFGLALQYGLTPESVLWSNYTTLKDNPDLLRLGQELSIPPADGLVYVVEPGDTIESIARRFRVEPEMIPAEPVNGLSDLNQALQTDQIVFVPGGEREVVVWQLPKPVEVRKTASGARVYSVGRCGEMEIPALGAGRFTFPTNRRYLSGYNFGPSHGGWDLAGRLGEPIYASDGGTVVYAGYSLDSTGRPRGYGQYVVLDHGNGYRSLYAHASQLFVRCGQQIARGTVIAAVGSVGKSTGPHLHFEIRLGDNYVNPARFMSLERR